MFTLALIVEGMWASSGRRLASSQSCLDAGVIVREALRTPDGVDRHRPAVIDRSVKSRAHSIEGREGETLIQPPTVCKAMPSMVSHHNHS